tara:strand:- start:223 stop:648 length:426 start_codon:yes stop_codon:yes gene_type:complete
MINSKIIYYDSECGLCNNAVKFIINADSKEKFSFSPLSLLTSNKDLVYPDSLVLLINNKLYFEGRAIINILKNLGFGWRLLGRMIEYLPINFINVFYRIIAINRKRAIFGKKKGCYIIPSNLKSRFILNHDIDTLNYNNHD